MSQEFIRFAAAHGVEIKTLDSSGRIRRVGTTEHPRSKNGAYRWDGERGWVCAWDGDGHVIGFKDPHARPPTAEEVRARQRQRQLLEDERNDLARQAAQKAARLLSLAKPGEHGYLQRKGLKDVPGLVLPDGELFVPMHHLVTNELQGAQVVQWVPDERRWEKKYLYGQQSRGAVLRLGPRQARETFLCEGYATGLSIEAGARHMRLSASVLVCFSAANLVHVAGLTRGERVVIADNDPPQRDPEKARINPGEAGQRAARATGLRWAAPAEEGTDANDVHHQHGLMALMALLMAARRSEAQAVP